MKLVVTSSPHIRGDFRTSRLMLDVVLALLPALAVGIWVLGIRALLVLLKEKGIPCALWPDGDTPRRIYEEAGFRFVRTMMAGRASWNR